MLSGKLPEDLMIEIMIRLPVKSLLRFKFVAKSWYALISDPSFITEQFEWSNSITKNSCLKILFQTNDSNVPPSISLLSDREGDSMVQDLQLPFPENDLKCISVFGQCNGILCVCGVYKKFDWRLILWSPATKEVRAVPASQWHPIGSQLYMAFGFGFDPITKDYKIVRLLYSPFGGEQTLVEVYNLSTNSCRTINVDFPIFKFYYLYGECYFNGAYHWLTNDLDNCKFIVSFDFSKEVFGIIQSPPLVTSSCMDRNLLAVMDNCLSWVCTHYDSFYDHILVDIWVMNEYGVESSWTKKFEIGPFHDFIEFFGFWGDNEILIREDDDDDSPLISYNLRNQQRGRLQIYLPELISIDYVESLFPLGGKRKPRKL